MEAEILLGLEGDVVLCPRCTAEIGRVSANMIHRGPGGVAEVTEPGRGRLYCRACGEGAFRHHVTRGTEVEDSLGPRLLVRSGKWTGWRALGGE